VPERAAPQLAGHADSRMTRRIYTHVTDAMLEAAAKAIEAAAATVSDDEFGSPNGSPGPFSDDQEPEDEA
jgi:predicted pyridoxine 5'-phosphate oxidase superfamily flavin-nucleotide-binding protein